MPGFVDSSAPLLRTLWIIGHTADLKITDSLLAGSISNLIDMSLTQVFLEALPPILSLRRLKLNLVDLNEDLAMFASIFLSIPLIEEIYFMDLLFGSENEVPAILPSITCINLQYLRSLFIIDEHSHILFYLQIFPLPKESLGISVNSTEIESRQYTPAIVSKWLEFARNASQTTQLSHATIKMDDDHPSYFYFGPLDPQLDHLDEFESSASYGRFPWDDYINFDTDPIFQRVRTLHIDRDFPRSPFSGDLDADYLGCVMPHLRTLTLESCDKQDAQPQVLDAIKTWIRNRNGSIESVRFLGCHKAMRVLADELVLEKNPPAIIWEEKDTKQSLSEDSDPASSDDDEDSNEDTGDGSSNDGGQW
jgi:hypothetical protein